MSNPSWALQQAVHAALSTDPALLAVLGAPRIYDDVPRKTPFPYLTLGQSTLRDWSTGTEDGHEHLLTLHVWSRASGRNETHAIMAAIEMALHDQSLPLVGHRLINLRHQFSEARREPDGVTYHGIVRFRAVTEPA
ncbi:MAG: DUF3168 domain-containing protein [Hyphomicrobiaceae bacterium]